MKILVISDVHSCIEALEAVWARESDADAIICAGDVVDWGWNPHEVICWLREHNAITVMGNHDLIVKNVYNSGNFQELGKEEEYRFHNANRLTEEDAAWLNALKETEIVTFGDTTYCIRHAYDVVESSSHVVDMIKSRSYIMGFEDMWREFVGNHECAEKRCIVLGLHSQGGQEFNVYKSRQYVVQTQRKFLPPRCRLYRHKRWNPGNASRRLLLEKGVSEDYELGLPR